MTGPSKSQHRLFWAALAAPGIIWLALLFIVPFYAILAIAGGGLDIAFEVKPTSRLSCQIKVTEAIDGLIVRTPSYQGR